MDLSPYNTDRLNRMHEERLIYISSYTAFLDLFGLRHDVDKTHTIPSSSYNLRTASGTLLENSDE
jgi:hypothetical protein